jgi:hypothetical protein
MCGNARSAHPVRAGHGQTEATEPTRGRAFSERRPQCYACRPFQDSATPVLAKAIGFPIEELVRKGRGLPRNEESFATINIGNSNLFLGPTDIEGQGNLENEAMHDTVNVNDQNDTTAHTATIDTVPRAGDYLGRLQGFSAICAPISWDYADTSAVNINFGAGTSVVNVLGTGTPG